MIGYSRRKVGAYTDKQAEKGRFFMEKRSFQRFFVLFVMCLSVTGLVVSTSNAQWRNSTASSPTFGWWTSSSSSSGSFPAVSDHGTHNANTEWWYFTGDLQSTTGARIGYEFTIFKLREAGGGSVTYVTHLAMTDVAKRKHTFSHIVKPGAATPKEGELVIDGNGSSYVFSPITGFDIKGSAENIMIDLHLTPQTKALGHGVDGKIVMPDKLESYYYSFPNLRTSGKIKFNGTVYYAGGRSWMDHQWGEFTTNYFNWNWFSIRLKDGGSLMLFDFKDGRTYLTYRDARGTIFRNLPFSLEANDTTRYYYNDYTRYKLGWTIKIPALNATMTVNPLMDAQSVYGILCSPYWEGLCTAKGTIGSRQISGSAYVELVTYCCPPED